MYKITTITVNPVLLEMWPFPRYPCFSHALAIKGGLSVAFILFVMCPPFCVIQ